MSIVSLQTTADPAFSWENAMSHKVIAYDLALEGLSPIPPFSFDPMQGTDEPASPWHLQHQQAHNDFLAALPTSAGASSTGIPIGWILVDTTFSDPGQLQWWTFANQNEHLAAMAAIA